MAHKLEFTFNGEGQLKAEIDATGQELMVAFMSLEGYICANLNMSPNEVRSTVDQMKSEYQAKPLPVD